ncbi:MAG: nickel pincer cofactor biosynthesis protein LarC [Planctomycetes bacterium]|nr:nickel pincer cofactor biosynthesis protein LarC [Planctomycetota bacterium]
MKIAYFDCFSGASGDMILGALVDAGFDFATLKQELSKLNLPSFNITSQKVKRCGIGGTKVDVVIRKEVPKELGVRSQDSRFRTQGHAHRKVEDIYNIIDNSSVNEDVKTDSKKVFLRLAEAESKVHSTLVTEAYFHEVGAVDAIVDIVGSVIAIKGLGIEKIYASPMRTGYGYMECLHGRLPIPSPVTLELLKGFQVDSTSIPYELVTPTGAAILATLGEAKDKYPTLSLSQVGYGAGKRDNPELPNLLRVVIGEVLPAAAAEEIWVVETNIDDMTGEICGYIFDKLFEAGAVDVYTTPIQMKKCRPAILLTALVPEQALARVEAILFDQSTTFGIRTYKISRKILEREITQVETKYGTVRVKIGRLDGQIKSISPEYEDCKKIAEERNVPLKLVYSAATEACSGE